LIENAAVIRRMKMKRGSTGKVLILAVLLVLIGWTWVQAQIPEFSADQILRGPGGEQKAKIYFKNDRWRVEFTQPQMQKTMVQIFRMDKKVAWMLIPEDKVYMESALPPEATPWSEKIPGEVERKSLGAESVSGHPCEKYQVKVWDGGAARELYLWISKKLKVPLKTETIDGQYGTELRNVQATAQPESLFELPSDFKKITPPLQS
jgi:hypothetical protein